MSIAIVPAPVRVDPGEGEFTLTGATVSGPLAEYVSETLGLAVVESGGDVRLELGSGAAPGGYTLEVVPTGIQLAADDAAGLFAGVQTLRQLAANGPVPCVSIEDHPRFSYRGAMLDVARHFFAVADVKRYIDDIALLKFNHLHLHLTDDQGWRLEILSRPELTAKGATTQVGGGGGGFAAPLYYTQDEYREIVAYAASRFITIVPEIDMPGHTNAAIVAYPELGDSPAEPYEGIEVGFSSLAIGSESTYEFIEDVVREVVGLTPGPYLHLGGDESLSTTDEDFLTFIARATALAAAHGRTIIGWHEMGRSRDLPAGTVGQYWSFTTPQEGAAEHTLSFVEQGGLIIMSPADVAYLDMAYEADAALGLVWANGPTSLEEAYDWDPADIVPGIGEEQLLGVEAPVWSETVGSIADVEYLAFPRMAAVAEIAWSPRGARQSFPDFVGRLGAIETVWDAAGIRHRPLDA
jgi:hexosaminidase